MSLLNSLGLGMLGLGSQSSSHCESPYCYGKCFQNVYSKNHIDILNSQMNAQKKYMKTVPYWHFDRLQVDFSQWSLGASSQMWRNLWTAR